MSVHKTSHAKARQHWARTRSLMFTCLGIWFFFGFIVHMFAPTLNEVKVLGFPLGFYFAAQGSLIAFVVLIFWYAHKQNKIDDECGLAEER